MYFNKILLLVLVLMTFLSFGMAVAQESGELPPEIDWASFGVQTGVIAGIITVVQFAKQWIPKNLVVFAPILLAVIAFFVIGGDQPKENVFYWAASAGYMWKMLNVVTPDKILKSKE